MGQPVVAVMVWVGRMVQDEGRPMVMVVSVTCGASPCSWGIAATMELLGEISANYVRVNSDGRRGASHSYLRSSTAIDLKDCMMTMPETIGGNVHSLTEANISTLWARCDERFVHRADLLRVYIL